MKTGGGEVSSNCCARSGRFTLDRGGIAGRDRDEADEVSEGAADSVGESSSVVEGIEAFDAANGLVVMGDGMWGAEECRGEESRGMLGDEREENMRGKARPDADLRRGSDTNAGDLAGCLLYVAGGEEEGETSSSNVKIGEGDRDLPDPGRGERDRLMSS